MAGEDSNKSLDAFYKQAEQMAKASAGVAKSINETAERLSNANIDKFVTSIKGAIKQTGLLSDAALDSVKSYKELSKMLEANDEALKKHEKNIKKIVELEKQREEVTGKLQKRQRAKIEAEIKELSNQVDAQKDTIESIKKLNATIEEQRKAVAKSQEQFEQLDKRLDGLGTTIRDQVKSYARLTVALASFGQALTITYRQMSRLNNRGMFQAMGTINQNSARLGLSNEELEDVVNNHRTQVNNAGGGVQGLDEFITSVHEARKGLEFLGTEGTKVAINLIDAAQDLGITMKDSGYSDAMKEMVESTKRLTEKFGGTYEENSALIKTLSTDVSLRERLNGLSKEQLKLESKELLLRTESLKAMGLSNDQIVAQNARNNASLTPSQMSFSNDMTQATSLDIMRTMTMSTLGSQNDEESKKRLRAMQDTEKEFQELKASLLSGDVRRIAKAKLSPGTDMMARSMSEGMSGVKDTRSLDMINSHRAGAGALGENVLSRGEAAAAAKREGRNVSDNFAILSDKSKLVESSFGTLKNTVDQLSAALKDSWLAKTVLGVGSLVGSQAGGGGFLSSLLGSAAGSAIGAGAASGGLKAVLSGLSGPALSSAMALIVPAALVTLAGTAAILGLKAIADDMLDKKTMAGLSDNRNSAAVKYAQDSYDSVIVSGGKVSPQMAKQWRAQGINVDDKYISGGSSGVPAGPGAVTGAAIANPNSQIAKIGAIESRGNYNAKNPLSSATGKYQFIDSTWISTVKKYGQKYGIDASTMSRDQILALRSNPDFQEKMMGEFTQANQRSIGRTDDGATYLAHFLGAGGAKTVLSANPATPISSLVSPNVMTANPQLRGMTANDTINWATRKMAGATPRIIAPNIETPATAVAAGSTVPTIAANDDPVLTEAQKQTSLLADMSSGIRRLAGNDQLKRTHLANLSTAGARG